MTRHEQREEVFRIVFSMDAQERADPTLAEQDIAAGFLESGLASAMSPADAEAVYKKAVAVGSLRGSLDERIAEVSQGWPLSRIGRAELNILRLALYEILYDSDVPAKVAIDEAVELAKTYCGDGAPGFVNGMLKHFVREDHPSES